jgi:hypothetical protein
VRECTNTILHGPDLCIHWPPESCGGEFPQELVLEHGNLGITPGEDVPELDRRQRQPTGFDGEALDEVWVETEVHVIDGPVDVPVRGMPRRHQQEIAPATGPSMEESAPFLDEAGPAFL